MVIKPTIGSIVWFCTLLFLVIIIMRIIWGSDILVLTKEEKCVFVILGISI